MAKIIKRIVRDVGHSNIVTLPKKMCDSVGIRKDTVVCFEQIENRIILTPIQEVHQKALGTEATEIAPAH